MLQPFLWKPHDSSPLHYSTSSSSISSNEFATTMITVCSLNASDILWNLDDHLDSHSSGVSLSKCRPLGHSTHFMQDPLDFSASQMHVLACMEQKSHDVTGCNTHILLLCPDLGHSLILCVPLMYTTYPSQLHYLWLLTPLESLLLSGLIMSKVVSSKPRSYCLSWAYIIQLVPSKSCY